MKQTFATILFTCVSLLCISDTQVKADGILDSYDDDRVIYRTRCLQPPDIWWSYEIKGDRIIEDNGATVFPIVEKNLSRGLYAGVVDQSDLGLGKITVIVDTQNRSVERRAPFLPWNKVVSMRCN